MAANVHAICVWGVVCQVGYYDEGEPMGDVMYGWAVRTKTEVEQTVTEEQSKLGTHDYYLLTCTYYRFRSCAPHSALCLKRRYCIETYQHCVRLYAVLMGQVSVVYVYLVEGHIDTGTFGVMPGHV